MTWASGLGDEGHLCHEGASALRLPLGDSWKARDPKQLAHTPAQHPTPLPPPMFHPFSHRLPHPLPPGPLAGLEDQVLQGGRQRLLRPHDLGQKLIPRTKGLGWGGGAGLTYSLGRLAEPQDTQVKCHQGR